MNDNATANDSHYRLCKKVAQLTKVIVQLNTLNESNVAERKRIIDSNEAEKERLTNTHAREIRQIAEEADEKVDLVQRECKARESALQELLATSKAEGKVVTEQLIAVKLEAKTRIDELESNHEKEKTSQAKIIRDISRSLEEQSRQHQENIISLRNELGGEHKRRTETLRHEISGSHEEEMTLLKSRHEQHILRIKAEASVNETSAVDNAVAMARLEYEKNMFEQISSHDEKYRSMEAEMALRVNEEVKSLQGELNRVKLLSDEIACLRASLEEKSASERKMQVEVKRLQTSLDSAALSNQVITSELQEKNHRLVGELSEAKRAIYKGRGSIEVLQTENHELKSLIDAVDGQMKILEKEHQALLDTRVKEQKQQLVQTEKTDTRIKVLQTELEATMATQDDLSEKLLMATSEISNLSDYKTCLKGKTLPALQILRAGVTQCREETVKLTQLFASSMDNFAKLENDMRTRYSEQVAVMKDSVQALEDEVIRLKHNNGTYEHERAESKTTITSLQKKIDYMQETANNAQHAMKGERLSWEKAMEDLKSQHKREQARLCVMAQDEEDILQNQIACVKDDITKEREGHERKCQLLETDWREKVRYESAITSRVRFESALEIQSLSVNMAELKDNFVSKENECKSLMHNITSLTEQCELEEKAHLCQLEAVSQRHEHELEEQRHLHGIQIQHKDEEIERIRLAKYDLSATSQQRIVELNDYIASEHSARLEELSDIKSWLYQLQGLCDEGIGEIKQEWQSFCTKVISSKLIAMKRDYDQTIERHSEEMQMLQITQAKVKEELNRQIASINKEAQDAKNMLFSTIREHEKKIERALRHQKEEHEVKIKSLKHENQVQGEILGKNIRDLNTEYETLACANAKKVDLIIQKDIQINQLRGKISNTIKSYEGETDSRRLEHQKELAKTERDVQALALVDKKILADEHRKEVAQMQLEMHAVQQQLEDSNANWDSRPSLPRDVVLIESLEQEIKALATAEKESKEKMIFFKRELENRDTNFNRRFSNEDAATKNGPLRVIQKQERVFSSAAPRRKLRGKAGGGTTRKKKAASNSSKLPKLSK